MQNPQTLHTYQTNAKGLRPFKKSEPKNLRHKRHNKCKTNAKGLRPFKRTKPKLTSEESKDGCQKGGDVFPSEPSAPIIRPTRNKYKEEQNPSRQQRARKGGDVFPQNTKFAHVASLVNKLSIEVPQKGGKPLFS